MRSDAHLTASTLVSWVLPLAFQSVIVWADAPLATTPP
jgi:hypothetical protein